MARVLENIGKELLRKTGVATPVFRVVSNSKDAVNAAAEIGYPVTIKALVTVGKRGKAGAVKFSDNPAETEKIAQQILSMTVRNFPVEQLLIEEKLDITQELYVSITFDTAKKAPVIVASTEGGIDIEEIARTRPEKIVRRHVNILEGLYQYQAKEIWSDIGLTGKALQQATQTLWKLYQVFENYDATILEVNPLAITSDGKIVAAAILLGVDDDALHRQSDLSGRVEEGSDRSWRPLTELEKKMVAVDAAEPYRGTARYTEMDGGDIGLLAGGGGGSLLAYDSLVRLGGKPANYTEFGGNPTETKVAGLVKGILTKPGVKGLFMSVNITNNTQTDVVAKGLISGFEDMHIDPGKFPTLVRLAGVNDTEAKRIFLEGGVEYYGDDVSMEDAAQLFIAKMQKA